MDYEVPSATGIARYRDEGSHWILAEEIALDEAGRAAMLEKFMQERAAEERLRLEKIREANLLVRVQELESLYRKRPVMVLTRSLQILELNGEQLLDALREDAKPVTGTGVRVRFPNGAIQALSGFLLLRALGNGATVSADAYSEYPPRSVEV